MLPGSALEFLNWDWSRIESHYQGLRSRNLSDANIAAWLADWSRLKELIEEGQSRLYVAKTLNTADRQREQRYQKYLEEIYTPAEQQDQKLKEKLLASGLEPEGFAIPLRNLRAQAELFRDANLPLLEQEKKLGSEYDRIRGGQTVEWEGEEVTLDRLFLELEGADRARREKAWRLGRLRQLQDRKALNDLWVRFLDLRSELARNADLAEYRSYRWRQLLRFDYTPDDCRRFHEAIEAVVVPAASRVINRRTRTLGIASMRPWDASADKNGRDPLRPFAAVRELVDKSAAIFHNVDPVLGSYFDSMQSERLLDLDNRKGKAPGGYNEPLAAARRPFIFMNAVGTARDVETLLHEAGHAFHVFEAAPLPYYPQLQVPMEFAEVASMSMELLASPYLTTEHGGFYSEEQAARARIDHLERILWFWPSMAVGDAFQHWVYEHPEAARDPDNCDQTFADLVGRFTPFIDWSDLAEELRAGWQRVLHFFLVPFYYVEYGMAQLAAVQIWRNALEDQAGAVQRYRSALALGYTVTLPELYQSAGARFAFDARTLGEAVALIESIIDRLEPRA